MADVPLLPQSVCIRCGELKDHPNHLKLVPHPMAGRMFKGDHYFRLTPIPIDEQAIRAAEQYNTGAFSHDIGLWLSCYKTACDHGILDDANRAKRRLYQLVTEAIRSQGEGK